MALRKSSKERKKGQKKSITTSQLVDMEINGTIYHTTLPKYFKQKKWKPSEPGDVKAVITGTVQKIFVNKKDPVVKGDCLLLLEAMKMNNEILAPIDGIVKDIFVTEHAPVSKGALMLKIKPPKVTLQKTEESAQ